MNGWNLKRARKCALLFVSEAERNGWKGEEKNERMERAEKV